MGKLNLQMYSFADGQHEDSRENLRTAAALGFDGVELFGPNFQIPAEELKALLSELKLTPVSLHGDSKALEGLIPLAKTLDMKFMGIGMELLKDEAAVHAFAKELNRLGEILRKEGITLTYHNHTQEFAPCGEKTILETLMEETDPSLVSFELDAGWCAAAGTDPIAFVESHAGRIKLLHIKESSKAVGPQPPMDFSGLPKGENGFPIFTEEIKADMDRLKKINCGPCEGLVDWKAMKECGDRCGVEAYIVEREYSEGDRVEALRKDIQTYRKIF